jgi:hypothetical protein
MLALQHFPKETSTSEIGAAILKDGACIVDHVLSSTFCDVLNDDFLGDLDKVEWGIDDLGYKDDFYGNQTKRLHGLFSRSPKMVDVLQNPVLLSVAKSILMADEKSRDIRLSNTELMVLSQNQKNQVFHSDAGSWFRVQGKERRDAPQGKGEILVSANYALTEFTDDNGATRVAPGSHLWEAGRSPKASEICLATMEKGSVLIYSGNVLHSGGANTTENIRTGLYLGYVVSWLRPLENQLVTNKPQDIFSLPESAQQLLDVIPGGFTVMA